jgi:hypothetical protein
MIRLKQSSALAVLRTTLALVVMAQAILFLYYSSATAAHVVPAPIRLVLGWGEVAGALLFLVPRTVVIGGCLLIVIFVFAAIIHVAHGQFEGALVIYIAAVIAVLSHHHAVERLPPERLKL